MQRNNGARLFPLFIILIVIALVIAAIVSIGRAVFNPSEPEASETVSDVGREALLNTSLSHSVTMTVRGPIVADESFKSYKIDVSPGQRQMNVYTGYIEDRTSGRTLGNNEPAYEQFVYALDKAEMMKGVVAEDDAADDLRGICASGYVHEFAVLEDNKVVKRLWTSTCGGSTGTLDASKEQLSELFLAQIPKSAELIPFRQSPILRF